MNPYAYAPPQVAWIGYLGILIVFVYSAVTVLVRAWMGRQR